MTDDSLKLQDEATDQKHNFVVGFMTNDFDVLLIQKKRPDWQAGKLNGVGGRVKIGERPILAMRREFAEETGARTVEEDWKLRIVLVNHSVIVRFFWSHKLDLFNNVISQTTDEKPVLLKHEHVAIDKVIANLKWIIPLCMDRDIEGPIMIHDIARPGI